MKQWQTIIKAIDPKDGEMKTWFGPNVPGITMKDAWNYCQKNGLGYCSIEGEIIAEIPCKKDSFEPDWDKMVDYEKINLN